MENLAGMVWGVCKSKLLEDTYEAEGFFPPRRQRALATVHSVALRSSRGPSSVVSRHWKILRNENERNGSIFDSERILHSILRDFNCTFVIDKNHKILYWNRALEKLTK